MALFAVVGGQWGDEGKGKVVDLLAQRSQWVVRFNGGNNAGHTVVNEHGSFGMHLVPSGIFSANSQCVIGNGVVIDPGAFLAELTEVEKAGAPLAQLWLSDRAHVIFPYHKLQDQLEERSKGSKSIGTTGRGIGPAYADKYARSGIRLGDLKDRDLFAARLQTALAFKNKLIVEVYGGEPLAFEPLFEEYCGYAKQLAPRIADTSAMLRDALARGESVLMEGAQASLLDVEFGTYPYVTSSHVTAAGAYIGAGIPPSYPLRSIGVFKAYCSRVGGGPFPTELHDEIGKLIRETGGEYGTTTGRPRRIGWFDAVSARYSADLNGLSAIALTRLDVLDNLKELRICTGYEIDGQLTRTLPANVEVLAKAIPVYETLPGWQAATSDARKFEQLPQLARRYVERLQELLAVDIDVVSVGPAREQTIVRKLFVS